MIKIKNSHDRFCISCHADDKDIKEVMINREKGLYKGQNICTFSLCNDCLRIMAKELNENV